MLKKSLLLLTLTVCMAGFNGNSEAAAAKALTAKDTVPLLLPKSCPSLRSSQILPVHSGSSAQPRFLTLGFPKL